MFKAFDRYQALASNRQLVVLALTGLALNLWASGLLNAAYSASKFPVPYWTAQLSFDHEKIKDWYAFLIANRTLDQYVYTQLVDFLFIGSVLILHTSALLAVSRACSEGSKARKYMVLAAALSTIAPLADAVENAISFVMLSDPARFPAMLAIGYSSMAALKFAMFTFAYAALPAGLLAALYLRFVRLRGRASEA